MTNGYLLIDGNNIGFAAAATKKLTVGEMEVQAVFGFMRAIRMAVARYPLLKPVVLWDGVSWRKHFYEEYKAGRDAPADTPAAKAQLALRKGYKVQRPLILKGLKHLGVSQLAAMNLEADDLAAILARRYAAQGKKVLMLSGDKDWIQLIQPNVSWFDPQRGELLTLNTLEKKLGYDPAKKRIVVCNGKDEIDGWMGVPSPRAWLEIKALMGDASDEIPGVGGIGEKGAIELLRTYGSVVSFRNQVLDRTIDAAKLPKKLRDFAEQEEKHFIFTRNMTLMDLNSPDIPAPARLKLTAGSLERDDFASFCSELSFKSILTDIDGWCEPFARAA
ncbi:DNA polymerase-1 [Faunimonas pinastri]|uniref:DNA polymerase-1 n=1 Tax=Faunimonas pinastri TaxID=1855383 RepID=A0A1H9MYU5_9HYPH|nr:5'-3' exonuclease H3TH domain-containing protein [Faunimonas pinastri]SER28649.1 DNA polymerase-1 [Faunimonas pinastri]